MKQHNLGTNGPLVSAQGLGCMGMSISYGEPDDAESIATIHRALELGVNLIVTSDAYGGLSREEIDTLTKAFPIGIAAGTRYPAKQMETVGI